MKLLLFYGRDPGEYHPIAMWELTLLLFSIGNSACASNDIYIYMSIVGIYDINDVNISDDADNNSSHVYTSEYIWMYEIGCNVQSNFVRFLFNLFNSVVRTSIHTVSLCLYIHEWISMWFWKWKYTSRRSNANKSLY